MVSPIPEDGSTTLPVQRRSPAACAVTVALTLAGWLLAVCGLGCSSQPGGAAPGLASVLDAPDQPLHAVVVRKPLGPPAIPSGTFDEKGNAVFIACATCHATKPANPDAKLGVALAQFHQGLVGKHGDLSCISCHNPADGYSTLRLADGKQLPYAEVMTLCAQCHGPQFRDYQHGVHGGMTGYWNLTRGGRVRNNCIDCHDPHAPKYPTVRPARGPNDRFQTGVGHE